jgi:hypothetical protein
MRSSEGRGGKIPLIVDVAIALALVASFIFFIVVMEYHVGAANLPTPNCVYLAQRYAQRIRPYRPATTINTIRKPKEDPNG